jgi:GNAT superfamily N-acetyltransferase
MNSEIKIYQTTEAHIKGLAELQRIVFPTLADHEYITEEKYLSHIKIFPEGQLVAMDGDRVVAGSSSMLIDIADADKSFLEVSDNIWITNHKPEAKWVYGMDVSVHPDYQRRGIGRMLYERRFEIAKSINATGCITAGMPNGYIKVADQMTIEEYCERLQKGEFKDPTVSAQMSYGFRWVKPLYDYLDDPKSGNACILMYWLVDDKDEEQVKKEFGL